MKLFETKQNNGRTVPITQSQVLAAWRKVRSAGGSGGVDGKSIADVESDLRDELYKLWNRMTSGSYFPQMVKATFIPKESGGERCLGIPTVIDRVAQQVVKDMLEPEMDKNFHPDSYGYRPNKNAHQAVSQCKQRCFEWAWVIDMDIKGFFDSIDHTLMLKALQKHTEARWLMLYTDRWLKAPMLLPDGQIQERQTGTPQGGVISPLLANLFLHYAFDKWMEARLPEIRFERYADDIVIHCRSEQEAEEVKAAVKDRLKACLLELSEQKTKIVYCKQQNRPKDYPVVTFNFLGFDFRPRKVRVREGRYTTGFSPSIGLKAQKRITQYFRKIRFHRAVSIELTEIAAQLAPRLRGWINYFGKFRIWSMQRVFRVLNNKLVKWIRNKYKTFRDNIVLARQKLKDIAKAYPNMFVHWQYGFFPG
jgi:group II intron reverse transcriptase/maturase